MIRIQQYRSVARTTQRQRRIMQSLGMRKIGHIREVVDNACIRGMIDKVTHLVRVLA
jgi:large subunit ribosomal protein L30